MIHCFKSIVCIHLSIDQFFHLNFELLLIVVAIYCFTRLLCLALTYRGPLFDQSFLVANLFVHLPRVRQSGTNGAGQTSFDQRMLTIRQSGRPGMQRFNNCCCNTSFQQARTYLSFTNGTKC